MSVVCERGGGGRKVVKFILDLASFPGSCVGGEEPGNEANTRLCN